jgi:hypothetical protein
MSKKKTRINPELVEQNNLKLKQFAEEVNRLQVDIEANDALSINHGKIALELALKAGATLREAKELVPHGEWEKWIADNVKAVELRTAQNYMKLAQEKAIVEERKKNNAEFGMKTKYVAFFEECQSLREAYIAVGIIKKTPATDGTGEVEQTPETMKRDNEQKYNQLLNTARQGMLTYVRNQIDTSNKRINWDLSTWTIKNNKPCSGDESNFGAKFFHSMLAWISFRNNSSLTRDDEVETKAGIVLNEVVKAIMLATTTAKTDDIKPEVVDTVPFFTFEPNAKPVEVLEVVEPVSV